MSFWHELRGSNILRDAEWNPNKLLSLSFRGNELGGEIGEAQNVLKKLERERLGLVGSRDTREHLAEELSDGVICLDLIAMELDIDLGYYVPRKFNLTSIERKLNIMMHEPSVHVTNQTIIDTTRGA